VNLVLFEAGEAGRPLPRTDPRAVHLLTVLRRSQGGTFDAGLVDGPRGKGTIAAVGADALELDFSWGEAPPPLDPVALVVGLPRPQTARKILQEACMLGVRSIDFVATGKGEAGYARSTLWTDGEWRRHLLCGAAQAFDTRLPRVTWGRTLEEVLGGLGDGGSRFALDNYEAERPLSATPCAAPVLLAVGPERGWAATERDLFRSSGVELVHLGRRVLRAETACTAAVAIVKGRLGLM
jgi:16S rRNA (uracil1498-N3)-methyltransferase